MAHAYTDEAVRRCLQAGVRSIEHANFVDEETVALMGEHGAFFDPTFISLVQRVESAGENGLSGTVVGNITHAIEQGRTVYSWARKHGVPIALGTDLWGPDARRSQLRELQLRSELDESRNVVRSATAVNADLLMMTGQLGTIRPGAFADLLVVDGDPLRDARILCQPETNLLPRHEGRRDAPRPPHRHRLAVRTLRSALLRASSPPPSPANRSLRLPHAMARRIRLPRWRTRYFDRFLN